MTPEEPKERAGAKRVVVLLLAVVLVTLAGLGMVYYQKVREVSGRITCASHLRGVGGAMLNFEATHDGFPSDNRADFPGKSFYVEILDELELQSLAPNGVLDPAGQAKPFLCPSRRTPAQAPGGRDYGYVAGGIVGGGILDAGPAPVKLKDANERAGTQYTALLSHIWMAPADYGKTTPGWASPTGHAVHKSERGYEDSDPAGAGSLGSPHPRGMPTVFVDGHVGVLPYNHPQFSLLFSYTNTSTKRRNVP